MIDKGMLHNDNGVVLVMVLLVLGATILLGIAVSRSAFFESKIAGNQRIYQNDFYTAEGASDFIISELTGIISTQGLQNVNVPISVSNKLPSSSPIYNTDITLTLKKTGPPPTGSRTSAVKTFAAYYEIKSTKNNQTITVGVWKAFPKSD